MRPAVVSQKDGRDWLNGLSVSIQAAADELEMELRIKRNLVNCQ